jgi:hypothetical protein
LANAHQTATATAIIRSGHNPSTHQDSTNVVSRIVEKVFPHVLALSSTITLLLMASFVEFVEQRHAFPARHFGAIACGNPFHFGPMCSFFIAHIAQNHAVVIESVPVAFLAFVFGHLFIPLLELHSSLLAMMTPIPIRFRPLTREV